MIKRKDAITNIYLLTINIGVSLLKTRLLRVIFVLRICPVLRDFLYKFSATRSLWRGLARRRNHGSEAYISVGDFFQRAGGHLSRIVQAGAKLTVTVVVDRRPQTSPHWLNALWSGNQTAGCRHAVVVRQSVRGA